jgi:hypothetical protein
MAGAWRGAGGEEDVSDALPGLLTSPLTEDVLMDARCGSWEKS